MGGRGLFFVSETDSPGNILGRELDDMRNISVNISQVGEVGGTGSDEIAGTGKLVGVDVVGGSMTEEDL